MLNRKSTYEVNVNGTKSGGDGAARFTAYVSPYFVVNNGGRYTKHVYAASQRIASKLGNTASFGSDPRRVETAGNQQFGTQQEALTATIQARYDSLKMSYEKPKNSTIIGGDVAKDSTVDSIEKESLIFFFHPDHLGSTSYVTGADGTVAQHVEYIPYGEVFVEERNSSFSTSYLFNAKELDNETGMYYYGARYLDPTEAMWISVDPMWEKFAGMSAYNYCAGNPVKMVDPDGRRSFNVTREDGSIDVSTIDDGVDGTFDIAEFDFNLLKFAFENSECPSDYEDYFDQLELGNVNYDLALSAREWEGSTDYAYDKRKGDFDKGTNKCNKFVYDRLRENELISKYRAGYPPRAGNYADPSEKIKAGSKGSMEVINDGSVHLGDVVAGKYNWSDASGHCEIVTQVYPKGYNGKQDSYFNTTGAHYDAVYASPKGYDMQQGTANVKFNPVTFRRAK